MTNHYPPWIEHFDATVRNDRMMQRFLADEWRFYSGRQPMPLAGHERVTVCLAIGAVRCRRALIVGMPVPHWSTALLMSAGVLVSDWARKQSTSSPGLQGDVLFITQQVGKARSKLRRLRIGARALGSASVGEIWDVLRVKGWDFRYRGHNPRMYLANPGNEDEITALRRVSVVVIDASHPRTLSRMRRLLHMENVKHAQVLILLMPAGYYGLGRVLDKSRRRDLVYWTWNPKALKCVCDRYHQGAGGRTHEGMGSVKRHLLVCNDHNLDSILSDVRKRLAQAMRHVGQRTPTAIRVAWWLHNRLSRLTVPLIEYEEKARQHIIAVPLKHRLETLQLLRPADDHGGELGSYLAVEWRPIVEGLAQAYDALLRRREPTKFWGAATFIQHVTNSGESGESPLRVVCPTQIEADLLVDQLTLVLDKAEKLMIPQWVSFVSAAEEARCLSARETRPTLLCGPRGSRWRHLDAFALEDTYVLAYPYEATVDEASLERTYRVLEKQVATAVRFKSLSELGLCAASPPEACLSRNDTLDIPVYTREIVCEESGSVPEPSTDRSLSALIPEPDDWSADWPEELGPMLHSGAEDEGIEGDTPEDQVWEASVVITLEDGKHVRYPSKMELDVFRPVNSALIRRPAENLQEGDILLLFDDDSFSDLYDRIVEALEAQRIIKSRMLLEMWELTKQQAFERFDEDLDELYEYLKDKGVSVQKPAVANWVEGRAIGPQKMRDFRLLALASKNRFAIDNVRKMRFAVGKVRGLRRLVGRRLGEMLRHAVTADDLETELGETDLAAEDILAAVSLQRVVSVREQEC